MKRRPMSKKRLFLPLLILFILMSLLPILLLGSQTIQQLIIKATGTNANLIIDASVTLGKINPVWNSYAQGGEASVDMLAPVLAAVTALHPRYIRIDHIYDHFNVVSRDTNGTLKFNFSELDAIVTTITKTGAIPFVSLSYMPSVIAEGGDITGKPTNWNEWSLVVRQTIEHISGKTQLNIADVYYEVWNEPDLFGNWKYYGDKNYLTLYEYSVNGATAATNTQSFKIGGPAITKLYKNWITALANYVTQKNLRLDFFSWHLYTKNPQEYAKDISNVTSWLFPYPSLVTLPRLITEWGFDSDINSGYDNMLSAAHAIATVRNTLAGYEHLFAFELVDGLDPAGKQYWGRWGLITHPSQGQVTKPRYSAFMLLNQIGGLRLLVKGEGTWVTGIATSGENGNVQLLVVNYDPTNSHVESVPIQFKGLKVGNYSLKKQSLRTQIMNSPAQTIQVTEATFSTQLIMPANTLPLLQLVPVSASSSANATPSGLTP